MSQPLRHFWFEFEIPVVVECPRGVRAGVGVTALDREDALAILEERVFPGKPLPRIGREVSEVVFHELCPWLVLPNMLDPAPRGVWFPVGYQW
jgi:hypothetical protein